MSNSSRFLSAAASFISCIVFAAGPRPACAEAQQSGWIRQNVSPYSNTFYAVDFVDANVGWVVGSGGIILHTADGGATWVQQSSGTTKSLYGVAFLDEHNGLAVGDGGIILLTDDGGDAWSIRTSGIASELYDVVYLNSRKAVAVGREGATARSSDGGMTWSYGSLYCMGMCFSAASFADSLAGIAVGDCNMTWRSLDGGATWSHRTYGYFGTLASSMLNGIVCFDSETAVAVGRYTEGTQFGLEKCARIWRTTNGGSSWSVVHSVGNTFAGYDEAFNDLSFMCRAVGIAVGNLGRIYYTENNGLTWVRRPTGTNCNLHGVCFVDVSTGTVVGAAGTILRTTNGGITWTSQTNVVTAAGLNAVHFRDSHSGVAVGEMGTIVATTDGGATWDFVGGALSVSHTYGFPKLLDVAFNGGTNGMAVGYEIGPEFDRTAPYSTLYRTTDGGLTWSRPAGVFFYGYRRNGCCFSTAARSFAVGNGTIEESPDGGATWERSAFPVLAELRKVFFCDSLSGTILGGSGIYRTGDGGANWNPQYTGSDTLLGLSFAGTDVGTVVGSAGLILHTTNGGATWNPQTSGTTMRLNAVFLTDANTGTVVGDAGTILRTTDGGETWTPQASGTTLNLRGVHFTDAMTGTVVGDGGVILRTTSGGTVAVSLERWAAIWAGYCARVTWVLRREALTSEPTFEVSRSADGGATFETLPAPDIELEGKEYILSDYTTQPGTRYIYRVVIRENAESIGSFELELEGPALSRTHAQNNPNPFNPRTAISFTIPEPVVVMVGIYDVAGKLVRTVFEGRLPAGPHEVVWDGRSEWGAEVASGVYFCRLAAGKEILSRKIVLMR